MLWDVTHEDWPFRLAVNEVEGPSETGNRYEIILVHKHKGMQITVGEIHSEYGNLLLAMKKAGGNVIINGVTFADQIAMQIETQGAKRISGEERKQEAAEAKPLLKGKTKELKP